MRIQVPLVIDMTDEQVSRYAAEYGLPEGGGKLRARDVVEHVQRRALTCVQDSEAFGETGDGHGTRSADVNLKRP
jgi:hypothetical protein